MARKTKAALAAEAAAKEATVETKAVNVEAVLPKEFADLTVEYVVEGSLKYSANGVVNMTVKMSHIGEEIPFTAAAHDPLEHGRWLHDQAINGAFGAIEEYDRPLPTVHDLQLELDKLMTDVTLGLASDDELALARNLRKQIKVMLEE